MQIKTHGTNNHAFIVHCQQPINFHVFGQRKEAGVPSDFPHIRRENVQTP